MHLNRESNLTKRVSEWTQRIEPILQQQEEAHQFDIHEYSNFLLHDIKKISQPGKNHSNKKVKEISFDKVVDGKNSEEVCRLFLTCLQLANLGNIEVLTENIDLNEMTFNSKKSREFFKVKLLDEQSKFGIEGYRAPSQVIESSLLNDSSITFVK